VFMAFRGCQHDTPLRGARRMLSEARLKAEIDQRVVRPMRRFWREIAVVLALKVVALLALYLLFFADPPPVPGLDRHLFSTEFAR
jgi:hypothetical protein